MRVFRIFKMFLLFLMSFCELQLMAQGVIVYKKDGTQMKFPYEELDSIVTYKEKNVPGNDEPVWADSSIYESLEIRGNFKTYLRLLADKDVNFENSPSLTEALRSIGSKTVLVADDEAWDKFFKANASLPEANPWHNATSYENLSVAQKRLLVHVSMLNDSVLSESIQNPSGGDVLRRYTNVENTDTIAHMTPDAIPYSHNSDDTDFWWRFRAKNGGNGLYIVKDASPNMMIHFTDDYLTKNTINDDDFTKVVGRKRSSGDEHAYDALLLEKNVACGNGHVNIAEKPLVPLANMAEVIRSNGKTNIFSHMLDRFSAPYYSDSITRACRTLFPDKFRDTDSVFIMRYFSDNSFGHIANNTQPNGKRYGGARLKFDPGWNGYYDTVDTEKDMAAIFAPSDEALWTYFTQGDGIRMIEAHDSNYIPGNTYDNLDELFQAIDQIPLTTLRDLINEVMIRSFAGSVPSKMNQLCNEDKNPLFTSEDMNKIDTCLLACNGAVYIMNEVYAPVGFASVASPAYFSVNNLVMKWAIYNGQSGTDYMGLKYYAYLNDMQSEFTFFLPSDEALQYYYDPISYKSNTPRLIQLAYKNQSFPITSKCYNYDPETGEIGRPITGSGASIDMDEITNHLKDILESHTIVHNGTNPINGEDEYFLSKNGNAIKVIRDESHRVVALKGGLQLENERNGLNGDNPGQTICNVTESFCELMNGQTYTIDAPIIPTYRSVYSILTEDEGWRKTAEEEWRTNCPYSEFFKLCETNSSIVRACGLVDEMKLSHSEQKTALKKYQIFADMNGLDYNIQFFNNYHYTAFIPSNEAVKEAIANGLPTWEQIEADYAKMEPVVISLDSLKEIMGKKDYVWKESDNITRNQLWEKAHADSIKLQAKITYLTNFIRYHFVDKSVFADKTAIPTFEMATSSYDEETGQFRKLYVDRPGDGLLRVRDGQEGSQMMTTIGEKNVLARDIECSLKPVGRPMASSGKRIILNASSACVIHQIPSILNHTKLQNGRHDSEWSTVAAAKKYIKKFAINDKQDNHE